MRDLGVAVFERGVQSVAADRVCRVAWLSVCERSGGRSVRSCCVLRAVAAYEPVRVGFACSDAGDRRFQRRCTVLAGGFSGGLLLAGPWVLYFAKLRYARPAKLGVWMLAGGAAAMFALLVYSNIRSEEQRDAASRARQLLEAVVNPRIDLRNISYMLYTDTAYNTMFILENYPERFGYQPLHGAWWVATNPIPRAIWAGKPAALGETLRDQMDSNANLGAGIVGQAWSEAGVLGVLYYAAFFGILLGIVDRTGGRATNPYFVVAIGASLGNMIAMARGDVGLFFIQVVASAVAVFRGVVDGEACGWPDRACIPRYSDPTGRFFFCWGDRCCGRFPARGRGPGCARVRCGRVECSLVFDLYTSCLHSAFCFCAVRIMLVARVKGVATDSVVRA